MLTYAAILIVDSIGKLNLSGLDPGKNIVYFVGFALYYTMVQMGTRYILAGVNSTTMRVIALCAWGAVTLLLCVITAVADITNQTGLLTFFVQNIKWVCLIPFLNVGLIDIMAGNRADVLTSLTEKPDSWNQIWPVLIVAAECLIVCLVIWKPFSGKLKTYLTI